MDYLALKTEVTTDPTGLGYGQYLLDAPGKVCELLNSQSTTMVKPRFVTARTVLAECAGGGDLLDKLEQIGTSIAAMKWAVVFLKQDTGLDIGHPATQDMLAQLAAGGALTADEATTLKALALQPASRAEMLGFGAITEADVRTAMETA